MELITIEQREKLLANGAASAAHPGGIDHAPVIKLFNPTSAATWLLSELDPEQPDIAFGLCDLGFDCPELGSVSISELQSVKGPFGLGIERDLVFESDIPLGRWAEVVSGTGSIIEAIAFMRDHLSANV